MSKFHIIIAVHNRVDRTLGVLRSLDQQAYQDFAVYIIDDGSTNGTAERVKEEFGSELDLHILFGNGNLWWSGASHLGIETALQTAVDDDIIVLMNDDIKFGNDFLIRAAGVVADYP